MIQLLAKRYNKHIACLLGFVFYLGWLLPIYGRGSSGEPIGQRYFYSIKYTKPSGYFGIPGWNDPSAINTKRKMAKAALPAENKGPLDINAIDKVDIDGPSQPEMSSFKPSGTNDMVNLFTGDFSYNIPLLDVGGYPVNIFYDGGIGMEQSASWVGLGWNINPGNINRNMRGVPDDFNGEEYLKQELKVKPNVTWGVRLGADFEKIGIKGNISVGGSFGVSFNNYLGPALELGLKGGIGITVATKTFSEKSAVHDLSVGVNAGIGANLNSRYGMTVTPNVGLSANVFLEDHTASVGIGLSTSYNSRTGIKGLQISSQASFNATDEEMHEENGKLYRVVEYGSIGVGLYSNSISFAKPTYLPSLRTANTNTAWSGHFQLGLGLFGIYGSGEVEVYKQKSRIADADIQQLKPMIGFLYEQNAVKNRDAIMDFSRVNDREVTEKTPVISAPQYAYDVFSIQGEGTGGSIRMIRDEVGYMKDKHTVSKDENWSIGADVGIPGHYGANFNTISTPSVIGEWGNGNKLRNTAVFKSNINDQQFIYFKNPGESSVISNNQYEAIGGTDLVRFKLGGNGFSPTIEPVLEKFNSQLRKTGEVQLLSALVLSRSKRTQVVSFLTASEADTIGLEKKIRNYNAQSPLGGDNNLFYTEISRFGAHRKKHHISQVNVTEQDGKRYVYGLPVYNLEQNDFTFTVGGANPDIDKVVYTSQEVSPYNSPHMSGQGKDGYVEVTTTPPYSHSFLLTGLLSPDYLDVNGDGITEDDIGNAVKFNYTQLANHKWRTPQSASSSTLQANFNGGKRTTAKDDKGIVSYGERESWYLHSIESKTMIAFFTLGDRHDGKGVNGVDGGVATGDNSIKRLDNIKLYNKADIKKNGLAGAKPIKTVHFEYSYLLCKGTEDNTTPNEGKLTLERIYFTYNGQNRNNKDQYRFSYLSTASGTPGDNPDYSFNGSDRWGNYKLASDNPGSLRNADYPYTIQNKITADKYAKSWMLKKILLPSGGQMEIEYESDDYAFVQNKRAAVMSGIIGFSATQNNPMNALYSINGNDIIEHDFVFITVPEACANKIEVYEKYLQNVEQLAFKVAVQMPGGGYEYLPCYARVADYGVHTGNPSPSIWVRMEKIAGFSPLSLTAVEFLREELPGQAFPGYDVSESSGLQQVGDLLSGLLDGLASAFKDIPRYLRGKGFAMIVDLSKSFVRINEGKGFKYGGGHRVKKVVLKDNWNRMTNQYGSTYGQVYDYTTTETLNGAVRVISSGVASYEPSVGSDENPFQTIVRISDKLPMGPATYGAIEMPVLDAFFPSPLVGYSKVTVTSIGKNQNPDPANKKTRSGVGKQVSEFYTAKDYPVFYTNTFFDNSSDLQEHINPKLAFFYKYGFDARALSQGFLIATNDMHGKMRSQSSYAENDPNTRINYTENFYRNTGSKGLEEKFEFVHNNLNGEVIPGSMGVDIELMTDTREFSVRSSSLEIQGQVDFFPIFPPCCWIPFIWPVVGESENTYRAVTTTKVINYHSVLDSVIVIDKGSKVSTKNIIYDAETGQVVVKRSNNEFNKPIYSVNYPAYWAYSGMGPAYKNIDAVYSAVNFLDGRITSGNVPASIIESGDEIYIINAGSSAGCDPAMASSGDRQLIWAMDTYKNNGPLTNTNPDFIFMDASGKPYSRTGVKFRIVRSGKRNMLGAPLASFAMMNYPVDPATHRLTINTSGNVINASAVEYKEKWQTDNDIFKKYKMVTPINPSGPELVTNGNFSSGNTGFTSDYTYSPANGSGSIDSYYNVATTTNPWYPPFADCLDHTSGSGNMMMVNGAQVSFRVWSQTINVSPNTNYKLSAWAASIANASPANLVFRINNVQVGSSLQLSSTTCQWANYQATWYSGSNTSAVITINDLNTNWQGNDFVLDDISFYADYTCGPHQEVEDCSGYLEKKINPYVKGLLGNFRGYRNMVFYGERQQTDPTQPTNLPVNGYLASFTPYWNFNASSNMIPDQSTTSKWVENLQSTRFNSKGMELETKDALNIFTSAQYGYAKTLPMAIANNARYGHMFAEGFEDYSYNDMLNKGAYNNCTERYIDFSNLAGSSIEDAAKLGISAHTGKNILKVDHGATVTKTINVQAPDDAFSLTTTPTSSNALYETGAAGTCGILPNYIPQTCQTSVGNMGLSNNFSIPSNPADFDYGATFDYLQYTNVPACAQYVFNMHIGLRVAGDFVGGSGTFTMTIMNMDDIVIAQKQLYCDAPYGGGGGGNLFTEDYPLTAYLAPGLYKIVTSFVGNFPFQNNPIYYQSSVLGEVGYTSSLASTSYKSLNPNSGCNFTKPIAASAPMINPVFALPYSTTGINKMVFSAWVREAISNVSNYTNNEVQIDIGGNVVTIKPSGPVIDGWQRYEGYFTLSGNSIELRLVNLNSMGPIYFDDIRMHPFNANMKSYVYDPVNLRLRAQLDANNYASFYEYDEEGTLIRSKVETREGIKTVSENRSARQKNITGFE